MFLSVQNVCLGFPVPSLPMQDIIESGVDEATCFARIPFPACQDKPPSDEDRTFDNAGMQYTVVVQTDNARNRKTKLLGSSKVRNKPYLSRVHKSMVEITCTTSTSSLSHASAIR